jgi:hypothetical protein
LPGGKLEIPLSPAIRDRRILRYLVGSPVFDGYLEERQFPSRG